MYKSQKNLPFKGISVKSFPEIVQPQTISSCNGRCVMCPHLVVYKNTNHGIMSFSLYEKIIDECASFEVKELKPFLTNEPLMDSRLADMISYARYKLPNTIIGFSSKGQLIRAM